MHNTAVITELLDSFIRKHKLNISFIDTASKWYIPLIEKLTKHQIGANRPFFIGVNGCQGSGKSTLSDLIADYMSELEHLSVIVLSLDDFYYSQGKRAELAESVHPLLKTRGVPGTHDTQLIHKVLSNLTEGKATKIPRFNKAIDNPLPEDQWPLVKEAADVVIFEGWCWGVPPQPIEALATPVNELEKDSDPDSSWRTYVNNKLATDYVPLYDFMHYWLLLKAPSFECVYRWRLEQEEKLKASLRADQDACRVMSPTQVNAFIQCYQRLTEHGLSNMPANCHCIFSLDGKRLIQEVTYNQIDA